MTAMADTLMASIHPEFDWACQDLARAKRIGLIEDTPAARAWVEVCRKRVDVLLDMRNALGVRS